MKTPSLSKGVVKAIQVAVDKVFDKAIARFLARPPVDKRIYIGTKPRVTLPSLFEAASAEERAKADKGILERLLDVAQGFVDAQREVTKARVVKAVGSWLAEAHAKGEETTTKDVEDVLGVQLYDVMRQAKDGMHKIVAAESNTAKNLGALDGIVKVNAASGIDDPIVYFVVVRDNILCEECKRLHLMPDGTTPRVWYLSEVGHGYHKKGQETPKLGGLHPHCRCTMVSLMPGYGFNGAGGVTYVKLGYDEMAKQRGLKKAEEPLKKSDWHTRYFLDQLARWGWQFDKQGGSHQMYTNTNFKPDRPFALKHEHMHSVPSYWVKKYGDQLGLKVNIHGEYEPKPGHPYHAHYAAPAAPAVESWTPSEQHQHVALDQLKSSKPMLDEGLVARHIAAMKRKQPLPAIKIMSLDGEHHIEEGDELAEAARRIGMTHAPVKS